MSNEQLHRILGREFPINGERLIFEEFQQVFQFVIGYIELGWVEHLEFYIEGMNLPADWK